MFIYVIKQGDTLQAIGEKYGFTVESLIETNGIANPDHLVVGQTLVMLYPKIVHIVVAGDDLDTIARRYNISIFNLFANNPSILQNNAIYIGQKLVISYQQPKIGTLSVYGFVYPYVDMDILKRTLPYLTYLSIFSYGFNKEGELRTVEDDAILQMALDFEVGPLLVLTSLDESGTFSSQIASAIFYDQNAQEVLIQNLIEVMHTKKYYGLDLDFEYIAPEDRDAYTQFVRNITEKLNAESFEVFVDLAPKTSEEQRGILYEAHNYRALGQAANYVLLMTYEWGYTYSAPMAVAPINKVRQVLDYAVSVIPPEKIFMGIPNYGYDWTLPFVQGESRARSIGNEEAIELAARYNATIMFDQISATPFFNYMDDEGARHEVWFEDARSIDTKVRTANEYHFEGIGYWNLMRYFQQNWSIVNALFHITNLSDG